MEAREEEEEVLNNFQSSLDSYIFKAKLCMMTQEDEIARLQADNIKLQKKLEDQEKSHNSYVKLSDFTTEQLRKDNSELRDKLEDAECRIAMLLSQMETTSISSGSIQPADVSISSNDNTSLSSLPDDTNLPQAGDPNSFFQENLPDDTYILLIGETGAGKSTFVNALCNYAEYPTIEEALQNGPQILIPVSFSTGPGTVPTEINLDPTVDDSYHRLKKNEIVETGQSTTQKASEFSLNFTKDSKTKRLHIIDTPGIGNVKGIKQDIINFDHILTIISNYKTLHTICIVIKPDPTKLNAVFAILDQLMPKLHKSAFQSFVFCFTGTSKTDYAPSQTLIDLRSYVHRLEEKHETRIELTDNTVYSLDNEGFRYLCAKKCGFDLPQNQINTYIESYNHSSKEAKRLLSNIALRKYHEVDDTLSINRIRQQLLTLIKSIIDISKKQIIKLHELDADITRNEKTAQTLVTSTSRHRTLDTGICLNATQAQREYDSARKSHLNKQKLKKVQITFELNAMRHCCVQSAVFLKSSSIMSYSDPYLEYNKILIKAEEEKGRVGNSNRIIINGLNEEQKSYQQEVIQLEKDVRNTGSFLIKNLEDFQAMVKKLYECQHYGSKLEHLHNTEQRIAGKSAQVNGSSINIKIN